MIRSLGSNPLGAGVNIQRNVGASVASQPDPVLSIDGYRDLVFIIRCARLILLLQRFLPKHEQIPGRLLRKLIKESKMLVPRGTRCRKKIPFSGAKIGWQFFLAVTAVRLSRAELLRARHQDLANIIDETYAFLSRLGVKALEKKRSKKATAPEETAV